jgi:ferric-dicitrate binding protein FerR (iron transport regulator)
MSSQRPPVEPLSRPAWERVEAGLFARLDRGEHLLPPEHELGHGRPVDEAPARGARRHLWWLAGAFAAAACIAVWLSVGAGGGVTAVVSPGASVEAPAPAALHEARIATTDAPTETTLGESVVVLAAHSEVNVAGSDAAGWRVRLETGQVDCQVAPRHGRPPFVVQAGATQVTVVGTRFSVARRGDTATVNVTEGKVQVDAGESHVLLGPGESWSKPEASAVASDAVSANGEAALEPPGADGDDAELAAPRGKAAPPAQQRFNRAARLESKNPRAAIAIYRDLARGKGPWAANALYAQARLELELGHTERAEKLLRRYLERHPRGLNAADVRALLERAER